MYDLVVNLKLIFSDFWIGLSTLGYCTVSSLPTTLTSICR